MGGPAPLCEHGGRIYHCIPCKGNGICFDVTHNDKPLRKSRCKGCSGIDLCKCGQDKNNCIDCKGKSICEHNKRRRRCPICNPNSKELCPCGKSITVCIKCCEKCPCGKYPARCKIHGGSQLCKAPLCETRGIKKYNGYCLPCCIHFCPDIEISRNFKTKERDIVERIIEKFPDFGWIADKRIEDGCSKRRPDLLLELGSHIIIVEVDENKHDTYDCSCENKRLMEISQDLNHRPIVFIRFNPDDYTDNAGKKIKSCWKLNGYGVLQITKSKIDEWKARISALQLQIDYWIENIPDKTIETIELFY
tara:strand:+ start:481 stop:1398 length:918 start_codon:yes stop_codon:yes gene_type:complete